jgi:tryptophan synthase beta chain
VFVAETLIHALDELREQYARYRTDPEFVAEFSTSSSTTSPAEPVYHASRWSERLGGAQLYQARD